MKTKVKGLYVIGFDGKDHIIYKSGEVVFEGDKIIFTGFDFPGEVEQTIDAGYSIVSPGFIDLDALCDIDHSILDVAVHKNPYSGSIPNELYRNHDFFSREEKAIKRKLSIIQLIQNGTTTAMPIAGDFLIGWDETYEEFADAAQIASDLGLRMYLGPCYHEAIWRGGELCFEEEKGMAGLEKACKFARDFDNTYSGLIKAFLAPVDTFGKTDQLLRKTKHFSDEYNIPIRLHLGEDPYEIIYLNQKYDKTPTEFLNHIGFLGPLTLLPHCIYLGDQNRIKKPAQDELHLIRESGSSIIHTPIAEAHGGQVMVSFSRYLAAGVNLTMGSDTHPVDMIRNMDFAWNISRIFERGEVLGADPDGTYSGRQTTAADYFRAATINGAKALGRDDLGKLAPGAKADIITIDLSPLQVGPIEDPIRTLIMNTSGANVSNVIINGRVVMRDKEIPGVNYSKVKENSQNYFDKMKQSYSDQDQSHRPTNIIFPDSFKIIEKE